MDNRGGWNRGMRLKRYCPRGHDTFIVGRYSSNGACRQCTKDRARSQWGAKANLAGSVDAVSN